MQKYELFERLFTVCPLSLRALIECGLGKIVFGAYRTVTDGCRRKLVDKRQEEVVYPVRTEFIVELCKDGTERFRVRIPPVNHAYVVKYFIDEPHRVEFARRHAFFVFASFIEERIQFFDKGAHLIHIGKDDITCRREQRFVKSAEVSDLFTYMKFIVRNFHSISVLRFIDVHI